MIRKFIRWLFRDILTIEREILVELRSIHALLAGEIQRQQPKRHQLIQPIGKVKNR